MVHKNRGLQEIPARLIRTGIFLFRKNVEKDGQSGFCCEYCAPPAHRDNAKGPSANLPMGLLRYAKYSPLC